MARILVADDQPEIRDILRTTCELDAHEAYTAGTVDEAVAAFIEHDPALMILDVNMPPQRGAEEILARLDTLGGTRDCAVIVMTGYIDEEAEKLGEQARVTSVMAKPFAIDAMRATIARALA